MANRTACFSKSLVLLLLSFCLLVGCGDSASQTESQGENPSSVVEVSKVPITLAYTATDS